MASSVKEQKLLGDVKLTSPLYEYWISPQNDENEIKRLSKLNPDSPASGLFKSEPYKWENLYQSIVKEIIKGDHDSIKGLKVLLDMLNEKERLKTLDLFNEYKILNSDLLSKLREREISKAPTKKNWARFARILLAIFTNPYEIEVKRKKAHLYEQTGMGIYTLRKLLGNISKKN